MKGDFTRDTFDPRKRYSSVRMQQGRVQLDADWNEQVDIDQHLRETSLGDLIGRSGAPRTGGGFQIGLTLDKKNLTLSAGRLYVEGILCELGPGATYTRQHADLDPKLADALAPALPKKNGTYFVYADVWHRHLTALEDPPIRETALGGPDTATRTQAFWRIRLDVKVDESSHCLSSPTAWKDATSAPSGELKARTHTGVTPEDPCIVPANAGYTRLENQLYRVEVHEKGSLGSKATFKWSRENGSVVSEWLSVDNVPDAKKPKLKVRSAGRDKVLGFEPGQWVELTDDVHEIENLPGRLAKLLDVQGDVLTLDLPTGPALSLAEYPVNPKVRRWDSAGEIDIDQPAANGGWLELEGGIEVRFEAGTYHTGDYWLIPARAFIGEFAGDVEWPKDGGGNPIGLPPHGVVHHYCKLAVVDYDGEKFSNPRDCRLLFPALTEVIHLFHVGGDGQEALPGEKLACPLEVGVTNGQWPVEGARVEFKASSGTIDVSGIVTTGADGVARCQWTLPGAPTSDPCLVVTATLRDVAGNPVSIPVVFHARLSLASQVAYDPGSCTHLQEAKTVQDALDILCRNADLSYVGGDGQEAAPGEMLPQPLEVRVANGRSPQPGARVRFQVVEGKGLLGEDRSGSASAGELTLPTDADGLAFCFWTLNWDTTDRRQRVEAVLLEGTASNEPEPVPVPGQVVHFNASFLERESERRVVIEEIRSLKDERPLENDTRVPVTRFADGFRVVCDQEIADHFRVDFDSARAVLAKPNVMAVLYLPYPIGRDSSFWGDTGIVGFQPLLLAGEAFVENEREIVWKPSGRTWLLEQLFRVLGSYNDLIDQLLIRIILKGHFIWSKYDENVFVDGDVFGRPGENQLVDLILPSGDGRRGGDFEMWLWLTPPVDLPSGLRLTDIPGVGRRIGAKLQERGVTSPVQVAEMEPAEIVEVGVSAKQARTIVESAKRLLRKGSEKPDED